MDQISEEQMEERRLAADLRTCVASLDGIDGERVQGEFCTFSASQLADRNLEMAAGHQIWKLIFELVHNLSEVISQTLPSFWKVAKGYMEGKYQKVGDYSFFFRTVSDSSIVEE